MKYNKPAITFQEQVKLLQSRGLYINDANDAAKKLSHINYYRLSAYRFTFCPPENRDVFIEGTTFDNLWNLYRFDRELRLLLLDAIERIEVSIRTTWANSLAITHDPHAYQNPHLFYNQIEHNSLLSKLDDEIERSYEEFIKHYLHKYDDPHRPSIWAICEILSLGTLSKFYGLLKNRSDRNRISKKYGLDEKYFKSFLQHLAQVRNFCAHHSRVWNRKFPTEIRFPKHLECYFNKSRPKNIYNTLVIILHFFNYLCPDSDWREEIKALINRYKEVNIINMGFRKDWLELEIWDPSKKKHRI